ncbi:bcl-2-interacting killer isoform 2-T3 [Rhynchonycteris naso]
MSQAGPLSRNLILCTFLQEHGLQALEAPGMTSLLQYDPDPHGDIPHEMAMRLAFIGDEMEVRWMLPRVAQMPWMAVYRFPLAGGASCPCCCCWCCSWTGVCTSFSDRCWPAQGGLAPPPRTATLEVALLVLSSF